MVRPNVVAGILAFALGAGVEVAQPAGVAAHGLAPTGPPSVAVLVLDWSFEPLIWLPIAVAALGWWWLIRRVDRAHPEHPVPRIRSAALYGGLAAILVALQSGIERYDTSLFSIHMVQHLLLTVAAPPLLALSAPITLLLRAASPDVRRRWILPVLHSRAIRVVGHPVFAWILFASVMWGTHFSPVFNESLENTFVHDVEHLAYLAAGLLFWWPAIGLDPSPYRLPHPARALYVFLQMPQNTFLAVTLLFAAAPLYPHYATEIRGWGPSPLEDQQLAAAIMWIWGDVTFITAVVLIVAGWMRHDEKAASSSDRRADAAMAAIREREVALAERRASEGR